MAALLRAMQLELGPEAPASASGPLPGITASCCGRHSAGNAGAAGASGVSARCPGVGGAAWARWVERGQILTGFGASLTHPPDSSLPNSDVVFSLWLFLKSRPWLLEAQLFSIAGVVGWGRAGKVLFTPNLKCSNRMAGPRVAERTLVPQMDLFKVHNYPEIS